MATSHDTSFTEPDRLRWYTRARRIPKLMGRTASGGTLIGGPYTLTQFTGGAIALLGINITRPLWGGDGLGDYLVIALVVAVVVFALKFVRTAGRNPALVIAGRAAGAVAPSYGRQNGRAIATPRGQRLASTVNVDLTPSPRLPRPASDPGTVRAPARPTPVVPAHRQGSPTTGPARNDTARRAPKPRRQILTVPTRPRAANAPGKHPTTVGNTAPREGAPTPRRGGRTRLEQLVATATGERPST